MHKYAQKIEKVRWMEFKGIQKQSKIYSVNYKVSVNKSFFLGLLFICFFVVVCLF